MTLQGNHTAVDLLWGKKLYRKMRFVLTVLDGHETILACTDISMDPLDIYISLS